MQAKRALPQTSYTQQCWGLHLDYGAKGIRRCVRFLVEAARPH
jgi:hypothetical protein